MQNSRQEEAPWRQEHGIPKEVKDCLMLRVLSEGAGVRTLDRFAITGTGDHCFSGLSSLSSAFRLFSLHPRHLISISTHSPLS